MAATYASAGDCFYFPLKPLQINKVLKSSLFCIHCLAIFSLTIGCFFSGKVEEFEEGAVDSKILPYCSIDKKDKKSVGEMEQDFLQALQVWFPKFVFPNLNVVLSCSIFDSTVKYSIITSV